VVEPIAPKTFFRDWRIPGPIPSGGLTGNPVTEPGETLDALSGHFRIFQLENGHRFSTDDILTAWYGTSWAPTVRTALDLGSGIGTVALVSAWRLPGARFVTVEAQEESVRLARKSAEWNGVADRFDIRLGDFRDASILGVERFDLVLGSPPYFPRGTGVEGDHPQKIACRFELRGDISAYCEVASKHLAPGGLFACVFPVDPDAQRERVRNSAREAGLAIVRWRPVILREGNPPLLGLFGMMRAEDLPEWMRTNTWMEPPLVIRKSNGLIHPEYSAIKLSFGFPP
jgi:tRNA1Val (adenine37-N6)-methyltransferase